MTILTKKVKTDDWINMLDMKKEDTQLPHSVSEIYCSVRTLIL